MYKITFSILLICLLPVVVLAQPGNRRIHNDKNAYRDCYQRMNAGGSHTLEIRNGELWAYGDNKFGQLGDGTTVNENRPEQIGSATNWVSVSAGEYHSLGVHADGTLWAWGWNLYGTVGDSTTVNQSSPVQIGNGNNWINISAGNAHSLAIRSDGTLWAWGLNASGQLGDGTDTNRTVPIQIGMANNWVSVSAGYNRSFALQANGTLWVWGDNTYGWLGIGVTGNQYSPVQIDSTHNWVSISAGPDHNLALKSDGTLWAWGNNLLGQLGDGAMVSETLPEQIGTSTNWVAVASGGYHSLALGADGTLWAWGADSTAQLGDEDSVQKNTPEQIAPGTKWVAINAGGEFSLGLSAAGQLSGWGNNSLGQLGNGNNTDQSTPQPISAVANWVKISPGANYTLALKSDGTLWAWGQNDAGNFGDSSAVYISDTAVHIGSATWIDISAGQDFSLGIQSDGTLWSWGSNYYGEVGNDTTKANALVPVKIDSSHNWISVAAGGVSGVALKANGTVWTWGSNYSGQLGRTTGNYLVPGQVGIDNNWIRIAAGTGGANPIGQTLAIKSDGTVWGWGNGIPLGNGSLGSPGTPLQIGTGNNWVAVAAGQGSSYALQANGTLWGWGGNYYGGLGDGTTNNATSPEQIGAAKNTWIQIASGSLHALGLQADGEVWSWGYNFSGQLGNGYTGGNQLTPSPAVPPTGWTTLGAGCEANSSLAIKPDRLSYCTSGANNLGQLGDGNNIQTNTFNCTSLATTPIAQFAADDTAICAGDSVIFSDRSINGPVYWQWTFTGATPANSTIQDPHVIYKTPGIYNVRLKISNSAGTDSITKNTYILVNPNPAAGLITGVDVVCYLSPVLLTDTGSVGQLQWQYSLNGISFKDISGDTISTLATDSAMLTSYFRVKATGVCGQDSSPAFILTVNPIPLPILSSNDSIICSGDSSLVCTGDTFVSYLWNTADTSSCIHAILAGGYWVTVTDANGCSAISAHQNISVHPVSSVSVVVQGDTLTSFNSSHYQWYFDNTLIPGANKSVYVAHHSGEYSVQVVDTNECYELSDNINLTISGIENTLENNGITIYPNPASAELYVESNGNISEIRIMDMLGQEIKWQSCHLPGTSAFRVNISELPAGTYEVLFYNGDQFMGSKPLIHELKTGNN